MNRSTLDLSRSEALMCGIDVFLGTATSILARHLTLNSIITAAYKVHAFIALSSSTFTLVRRTFTQQPRSSSSSSTAPRSINL